MTALFVYLTRSCNLNCDNLGHMGSVEELWTFKAHSPLCSSAVMDFDAALGQTLLGMAWFSLNTFLSFPVFYQPQSSCNIYFSSYMYLVLYCE